MSPHKQSETATLDLVVPSDRFASASRLYGRLHRWWLLVRRYWWVTALAMAIMLPVVFLLTATSAPAYESKARLWLTGKLDLYEGRLYTEELINYLGTQAELLRSPTIQDRAMDRLREQFKHNPAVLNRARGLRPRLVQLLKTGWTSMFGSSTNRPGRPPCPFQVKVLEGAKSSTLELTAIGAEPTSTRAFLNDLMEEYLQFKKEAREKTSDQTVASLGTEASQLKRELEAQQAKLHAFQSSNNVVFLQEQGNSAAGYLGSLHRRLAALHTELRLLKSLPPEQWVELKSGRGGVTLPDPGADDAATKEALTSLAEPQADLFKANQQMQLLKAKRDELSRFLRPLHPKILKLNEQIATQEKVVGISRDEALKQLANRRQTIETQILNLEAESKDWDSNALEASRKMADYEQLRRNLERLQTAYDKSLSLIQTVDVSKKVEQENVGILEPASLAVPTHRLLRNLAIALLGSILLGFGSLYGIALFRDDFTSLTEVAHQLSEEVVGQIPAIALQPPEGRFGIEMLERQRFEFLEAFRSLRSAILLMGNGSTKPRTIIVTSSIPEEGKSTIALYLAATIAKANTRVLLIDADMRRATLHQFFGVAAGPGLAELLEGEATVAETIVPTRLPHLSLLPAGEARRNPGDLVWSPVWTDFLSQVRGQYDYILLDSPPVLATDDAAALAPKADGVLFVVRGSFTSARMAREAVEGLRRRQARLLGLVFNRTVSSPYEYHYYQRYGRAYRWDSAEGGRVAMPAGLVEDSNHL